MPLASRSQPARRRLTPAGLRVLLALLLVAVVPLPGRAAAQDAPDQPAEVGRHDRFAGWDTLRDENYRFDPQARSTPGFSVRASAGARTLLGRAEQALAAGEVREAARLLLEAVASTEDQVVQVGGDPGRWVGAAEWALYLLRTSIPWQTRLELQTPEDLAALEEARAARDETRLLALIARRDGLPLAVRAWESVSRLAAERGDSEWAHAALQRARLLGREPATVGGALRETQAAPPPAATQPNLPASVSPLWQRPLPVSLLGPQNPFAQAPGYHEAPIAPVVPLVAGRVVYVADSISVEALDLLSGRLLWRHAGPLEVVQTQRLGREWFGFDKYVDGWRKRAISPYLESEPLLADERLVAVEQVAEAVRPLTDFDGIPINWPLPRRRLVALDAADGRVLWRQERPLLGSEAFENRFDAAGRPVRFGSLVLAAGHIADGAIHAYLAAFDLRDGRLVWRTLLASGQQDLTMFNRPFAEHVSSGPTVEGSDVFVCTNLGVVACVDAPTGRVRWLSSYPALERFASRSPNRDLRRDVHFVNRPPQFRDGRLLVMPLDATELQLLQPATGRQIRSIRTPGDHGSRHDALLLPGHLLLLAGDSGLEGLGLDRMSRGDWHIPIGSPARSELVGALSHDGYHVYVPLNEGLVVVSPHERAVVASLPWEGALSRGGARRVVPAELGLVATDGGNVYASVDVDAALAAVFSGAESGLDALLAADLLAAAGRPEEAAQRYDTVLAAGRPQDLARAAAGRLAAELQLARAADTPEAWEALLLQAERLGDLWARAPEALSALLALGADERADFWLDHLAALDPDRPLRIPALAGDGPRPAGLFAALRGIARAAPAAAVERLQELIETFPDATWEGEPVRAWAARRIGGLLERHGRPLYDRFESLAEAALRRADDSGALAAIEARFPNARVVIEARARRLEHLLEDGRALEVLEELAQPSPLRASGGMNDLRQRAAQAAGELRVAARLGGELLRPEPVWLPTLPGPGARSEELLVSTRGRIVFPPVRGTRAPDDGQRLLAVLNDVGELFALDAQAGRILWRRPLPGGLAYASPGLVDFLLDGEVLVVAVHRPRDNLGGGDLLEAVHLADGRLLWTKRFERESHDALVAGGLLWRLESVAAPAGRSFRATARGTATGALVAVLELPPSVDAQLLAAGGHVLAFTVGALGSDGRALDGKLIVLDPVSGAVSKVTAVPGEAPNPVRLLDDPPLVVLGLRRSGGGAGSRLLAFDAASAELRWNAEVDAGLVRPEALHAVGGGQLLLDTALRRDGTWWASRLTLFDGHTGRLGQSELPAQLSLVAGQAVPRNGARAGRAGGADVTRLLFEDHSAAGRFVLVDGATATATHELRITGGVSGVVRAAQGRDGFALLIESVTAAGAAGVLRVFDGDTGAERYSGSLGGTRGQDRLELALAEGVVVTASGGRLNLLRSPAR